MKIGILSVAASMALLCACQPATTKTTISGNLSDMGSNTLIVQSMPVNREGSPKRDTVVMQNGAFTLELDLDTIPAEVHIFPKPGIGQMARIDNINFVIFPNESLTVSGNIDKYTVEGSDFYAAYNEAIRGWQTYEDSLQSLSAQAQKMEREGVAADSIEAFYAPAEELMQKMLDTQLEYIRQHPDSDVALYIASRIGYRKVKEVFPLLSDNVKTGKLAPLYQMMDNALKREEARIEAKKNIVEGATAPDFTLKDIEGNDLTLSSLRGKYVVLDFWGSWCGWCIKGMPEMKKYYAKYGNRMEILGIDCRDTEEKWKEAVKKHELPWLHVRNAGDTEVSLLYAIEGYPTKIVIDPDGKITKVVLGEDPAFYEYIDKLFK